MRNLEVKKDGRPCYKICFAHDFLHLGEELLRLGFSGHRLCIVTDSNVAPLYLEAVKDSLADDFPMIGEFVFPAGESSKTLAIVQHLYEYLIGNGFDRKDCLIALGGGVTGDLTGFTAATYLRGIDFVQIPTTLLAQVDSSIGGKTGVDLDSYKNMVGAFHMPRLVYMNLSVLNTLPPEQFSCGMGEVLKHGLIRNKDYFRWCADHAKQILERDPETLLAMVEESCRIKRDVVEEDPTEQGVRALLNFGHTIGHAVEKLKNFALLHGQCVAIGCAAAMKLSVMRGNLTEDELLQAEQCFARFSLPVRTDGLSAGQIVQTTRSDKKMEAGKIKFILLEEIGSAFIDKTVSDGELLAAAEYILH